jgi:hypothetical protein
LPIWEALASEEGDVIRGWQESGWGLAHLDAPCWATASQQQSPVPAHSPELFQKLHRYHPFRAPRMQTPPLPMPAPFWVCYVPLYGTLEEKSSTGFARIKWVNTYNTFRHLPPLLLLAALVNLSEESMRYHSAMFTSFPKFIAMVGWINITLSVM